MSEENPLERAIHHENSVERLYIIFKLVNLEKLNLSSNEIVNK